MNKTLLTTIIGIVLLLGGALTYTLFSTDTPANTSKNSEGISLEQSPEKTIPLDSNARNGVYVDYSEDLLLSTRGTKLLFFHAPWCPQCREMEASIVKDGLPSGVTVLKIDYDSNQALRQKYGVTLQTTFVKVDDMGNKIATYVAYEEPQFSSVERELLR